MTVRFMLSLTAVLLSMTVASAYAAADKAAPAPSSVDEIELYGETEDLYEGMDDEDLRNTIKAHEKTQQALVKK